jgi:hypothetical protein
MYSKQFGNFGPVTRLQSLNMFALYVTTDEQNENIWQWQPKMIVGDDHLNLKNENGDFI